MKMPPSLFAVTATTMLLAGAGPSSRMLPTPNKKSAKQRRKNSEKRKAKRKRDKRLAAMGRLHKHYW